MASTTRQPNIVLILGDYMGYGDIGPTGVGDIATPYLDRLAHEGILFTDVCAAAPICSPSRAAILTGRMPARIGLENNVNFGSGEPGLPAAEVSMAKLLRQAGYRTGLFGKWHLGMGEGCDPLDHGFEEFLGFHDWSIDYHTHRMMNGQPGLYAQRSPVQREGYSTDLFAGETASFIERHRHEPFFAFLSFNAALPPLQPPDAARERREAANWRAGSREAHCAVVAGVDQAIGGVLDTLERLGLTERTLVLFTYDHGGKEYSRRTPFFHGFASLWEGGIRVPLIMRYPDGFTGSQVRSTSVSLMDLLPTVAGLAKVELHREVRLDGIDLGRLIHGQSEGPQRTFYWRIAFHNRHQRAIRRGPWKYLWDATAGFLFDVVRDPGEREDRFYQHPDIAMALHAALADWEREFPNR